jgi:hypothetical protein
MTSLLFLSIQGTTKVHFLQEDFQGELPQVTGQVKLLSDLPSLYQSKDPIHSLVCSKPTTPALQIVLETLS